MHALVVRKGIDQSYGNRSCPECVSLPCESNGRMFSFCFLFFVGLLQSEMTFVIAVAWVWPQGVRLLEDGTVPKAFLGIDFREISDKRLSEVVCRFIE